MYTIWWMFSLSVQFINETTGFLLESNSIGHIVFKTTNSGTTWTAIGGGAPTLLGFYLVNSNTDLFSYNLG